MLLGLILVLAIQWIGIFGATIRSVHQHPRTLNATERQADSNFTYIVRSSQDSTWPYYTLKQSKIQNGSIFDIINTSVLARNSTSKKTAPHVRTFVEDSKNGAWNTGKDFKRIKCLKKNPVYITFKVLIQLARTNIASSIRLGCHGSTILGSCIFSSSIWMKKIIQR